MSYKPKKNKKKDSLAVDTKKESSQSGKKTQDFESPQKIQDSPTKLKESSSKDPNQPLEFASNVNYNENESVFTTFLIQTYTLTWKNFVIFSRKIQVLMFLVATPLVVTYLLNVMAGIGDSLTSSGKIDQPKTVIGNVNKCLTGTEISTKEYVSLCLQFTFLILTNLFKKY